jgi:hypothetical protein
MQDETQPNQQVPHQVQPPAATPALDKIHVMIRNRRQVIFNDDIKALTSKNDTGVFDILPEHSNFISVLKDEITLHKLDGTKQIIPLKNGIIKVKDTGVKCYIDLLTVDTSKLQANAVPIQNPAKSSEPPQQAPR